MSGRRTGEGDVRGRSRGAAAPRRFRRDESGATAIEYALIAGLIFLALTTALSVYGDSAVASTATSATGRRGHALRPSSARHSLRREPEIVQAVPDLPGQDVRQRVGLLRAVAHQPDAAGRQGREPVLRPSTRMPGRSALSGSTETASPASTAAPTAVDSS